MKHDSSGLDDEDLMLSDKDDYSKKQDLSGQGALGGAVVGHDKQRDSDDDRQDGSGLNAFVTDGTTKKGSGEKSPASGSSRRQSPGASERNAMGLVGKDGKKDDKSPSRVNKDGKSSGKESGSNMPKSNQRKMSPKLREPIDPEVERRVNEEMKKQ